MREFASDWLKFRNKDSVLFLLFAISLNVCFKGALGTFLTLNGYGLSIVSPPLAFFFAAFDTLIAIGLFFVVDKFHGKKLRLTVYHIVIIGSIVFFYGNYLIYEYFRTFINWGLICFNGAGTKELMSYIAGSKGGMALLFSFAAVILLIISGKRKLIKVFYGHQTMILALVIINLAVYIFLAQFGRAETGKMARNPGVELFTSIINEAVFKHDIPYPEGFSAPASLIFGKEESTEKTTGEISHNRIDNVLVIMIESFPLDMTVFGNSSENSFKIFDRLKESSVVFTSYRTVFPGTSRSFITANCGSLPGTAQETITNYMPDFRCTSLAEVFGKGGFQTGFFGSALFTYDNLSSGIFAKKYNVFKDFNSLKKKYGSDGKMYSYQVRDEDTLKEALGFMKDVSNKGGKFFTYTFLYSTHYPYESPLSGNERKGTIESYRRTQLYLSNIIEDLLDKMDGSGILENTAVIITADHGEAFGKRKGVFGHGHSLYDEAIKIPLLIYLPGMKQGIVTKRQGTHVDLAPTLAAIAGIAPAESWQGVDLLDSSSKSRPALIFTRSSTKLNGIIDGNLKYIYDVNERTEKMFDLEKDPDELHNIAEEKIEESGYYKTLVTNWTAYQQKWITNK